MDFERVTDLQRQHEDFIHWCEIDYSSRENIPSESQIADDFFEGYNIRWWRSFFALSVAYGILRFSKNEAKLAGFDVFE